MSYTSTAKQRLWLTCLDVDDDLTAEEARALFDEAKSVYKSTPNSVQRQLAKATGVDFGPTDTRHNAAGALYELLLSCAWVHSVARIFTGSRAKSHTGSGVSAEAALAIGHDLKRAGLSQQIHEYSSTDSSEGDVWYRMSKSAKDSAAFSFVADRLAPMQLRPAASSSTRPSRQGSSPGRSGCLVVVAGISALGALVVLLIQG